MSNLRDDLTFSNPRQLASFDDWPSGGHRVKCLFYSEHAPGRGWRLCRKTTDKHGSWCKPRKMTYAPGRPVIVDGSDGLTYILQVSGYGHIDVWRGDLYSEALLFDSHERFKELEKLIDSIASKVAG